MDDDLFSNPFGVSSGGGEKKVTKSRSINVDAKMGNRALKERVRSDRRRQEAKRQTNTFHKPKDDVMFDAFDDLEEEMIGEGVIGNGNKKQKKVERTASIAPTRNLDWSSNGTSGQSQRTRSSRNGGHGGSSSRSGGDDGWF